MQTEIINTSFQNLNIKKFNLLEGEVHKRVYTTNSVLPESDKVISLASAPHLAMLINVMALDHMSMGVVGKVTYLNDIHFRLFEVPHAVSNMDVPCFCVSCIINNKYYECSLSSLIAESGRNFDLNSGSLTRIHRKFITTSCLDESFNIANILMAKWPNINLQLSNKIENDSLSESELMPTIRLSGNLTPAMIKFKYNICKMDLFYIVFGRNNPTINKYKNELDSINSELEIVKRNKEYFFCNKCNRAVNKCLIGEVTMTTKTCNVACSVS